MSAPPKTSGPSKKASRPVSLFLRFGVGGAATSVLAALSLMSPVNAIESGFLGFFRPQTSSSEVLHEAVSNSSPQPGDSVAIEINAATFSPDVSVEIYLRNTATSTEVQLASMLSAANGALIANVVIPQDSPIGDHTIQLRSNDQKVVDVPITVSANPTPDKIFINYDHPGQYGMTPCLSDSDNDCIVSIGYRNFDNRFVSAGYLAKNPGDDFVCTDGHLFLGSGTFWNFPLLKNQASTSALLVHPSLTAPRFNHDCQRGTHTSPPAPSPPSSGDSHNDPAEKVFVSLYAAQVNGDGTYNQGGSAPVLCPLPTGKTCNKRYGPGEDTEFEITLRISRFSMAYAYASTRDTKVIIQDLPDGQTLVTLTGKPHTIPGVWDGSEFNQGSLKTTDRADFLEQMWFFEMKNANDPGFPSECSSHGFPVVSGNHAWGGEPRWDNQAKLLRFNMGAPHLDPDGKVFLGHYEARIPLNYAECLWGIDPADLVNDLEVALRNEDGTERSGDEFVASISIVGDVLHIDATGFHFSEPEVVVRSTKAFTALDRPVRVVDTRPLLGRVGAVDGSGSVFEVQVGGVGGVPVGVAAVALNVTVVEGVANDFGGFVTVFPCGKRPDASNLNFRSGQTVPNAVIAPVSSTGKVCFYVYGTAHLLVDVSGYFP